jgi:hypothetical protein
VHTTTDTDRGIADWLAGALDDPTQAHTEWKELRVAMLPLGVRFTAVRISHDLVHAAVSSTAPDVVTSVLSEALAGPVIHDAVCHRYYAVTPDLDMGGWRPAEGAVLVGRGTWLGVPRLDQTTPQRYSYWSVPPELPRTFCDLGRVAQLVHFGREQLAAAEQAGKRP